MKRLSMLVGVCCLLLAGCEAASQADSFRDAAAIDFAVATMIDSDVPAPPAPERCPRCNGSGWITHGDGHKTPCPDCQNGSDGPYGGPLDTLRQAKELIAKGNELADRGKALLDAAQRDGKITVDIRLPETTPPVLGQSPPTAGNTTCPGGVCPYVPAPLSPPWTPIDQGHTTAPPAETGVSDAGTAWSCSGGTCSGGVCRPRLFWRRRQ